MNMKAKISISKDDVRTSRFLSLILRHKPEAGNLTLDSEGWAEVPKILYALKVTMTDLERIVAQDNKGRYSFNKDKTKIRANQGHSVKVDLGLEPIQPPRILYHGTGEKYVESIKEKGLISKTRNHVHLSKEWDTAYQVGSRHGKPVVFIIDSARMHYDGLKFYKSKNGVWLTDYVPYKYMMLDAASALPNKRK